MFSLYVKKVGDKPRLVLKDIKTADEAMDKKREYYLLNDIETKVFFKKTYDRQANAM